MKSRRSRPVGLVLGCLLASATACDDEPPEVPPSAATPRLADAAEAWAAQGQAALARAEALTLRRGPARNVVVFIGDGMGLSTVTAARILEGQAAGQPGEEHALAFEGFPHVALIKTYNTNQQTPDSAGTMTAMMTGAKTRAGVLGVDGSVPRGDAGAVEGHRLRTLFEEAEERGLATGIVTTASVTHATPAACYAHAPDRGWEGDTNLPAGAQEIDFPDIARQLVECPHGDGVDVVLGGGRRFFLPRETPDLE